MSALSGGVHRLIGTRSTRKAPDKHCVFSGDAKVARIRIPIETQLLVAMPSHALQSNSVLKTWRVPGRLRSRGSGALRISSSGRASMISSTTGGDLGSVQIMSLATLGKAKAKPRKNLH